MTLPRYTGVTVQTTTNAPAPAATVTVYLHNTNVPADLFSDEAGATPLANPLTSDAVTGLFTFCVANGLYDLTVTGIAVTPYTIPGVQLIYQGAPVGQIRIASNVFTHAQVLTLPTQELNVTPTPGVGQQVVPLYARLVLDTTAGAYTNIDPGSTPGTGAFMSLSWENGGQDAFSYLVNGYGGGTFNTTQSMMSQFFGVVGQQFWEPLRYGAGKDPSDSTTIPYFISGWGLCGDPTVVAAATMVGTPLVLFATNGALGNFTGGDPANTLTTTLAYLLL